MNYRHAFHAGNHADVLKHIVQLALLDTFKRKDSPFFVLDTHGGAGRYLLASEESRKTLEAEEGVMRLMAQPTLPAVVERYLKAVQADNPVGAMISYPGSPLLTARALREQDRMAVCEVQDDEAASLKALFAHDSRVGVYHADGYAQNRALLPPKANGVKIGRGLVLIDPPYEGQDAEYQAILASVSEILGRWPQATFAIWFPIKQRRTILHFCARPVRCGEVGADRRTADPAGRLAAAAQWQRHAAAQPALAVRPGAGPGHAGAEAVPGRGRRQHPAAVAQAGRMSVLARP